MRFLVTEDISSNYIPVMSDGGYTIEVIPSDEFWMLVRWRKNLMGNTKAVLEITSSDFWKNLPRNDLFFVIVSEWNEHGNLIYFFGLTYKCFFLILILKKISYADFLVWVSVWVCVKNLKVIPKQFLRLLRQIFEKIFLVMTFLEFCYLNSEFWIL